ncbi:MAG: ElyC/SanA/YdcF family protein [Bacteroidota bacterium]
MVKKIINKKTLLSLAAIVFIIAFMANNSIEKNTIHKTFDSSLKIKHNKVGLVLGTSKLLSDGRINLYFKYRISAVVELFNAKKIDFILVSGDNSKATYDEPSDFKNELIKYGIPENKIFLDYAGFRTLDSVVRAKEVFGLNEFTIISQKFHNERAIFLADNYSINAIGFNAKDVNGKNGIKTKIREYLARTKAYIDIVIGVKPKFLGEKIEIK